AANFVPPMDSHRASRVADEFQNKLLAYRFANFSKVAMPSFDLGQLTAPARAMAHCMAGAIVGADDLQAQIVAFLRELDAGIRTDSAMTLNAIILEVLFTRWTENEVGNTELAGDVNTMIAGRGGSIELSPETVGWKLKSLGLRTTTISRGLRGLRMADVRS